MGHYNILKKTYKQAIKKGFEGKPWTVKEASDNVGLLLFFWQVMVMQEGSTSLFGQHLKLPTLPNSLLTSTFSDPKKSKSFHGSKVSVVSMHGLDLNSPLPLLSASPSSGPVLPLQSFQALIPHIISRFKDFQCSRPGDFTDIPLWLKQNLDCFSSIRIYLPPAVAAPLSL